jgi:flagellar hook-associated protein 3 FlgL
MQFDPKYLTNLSGALSQSSSAESTLTAELSSGLRVTSPQVDPVAAAQSSQIGSAIARDDSYVQAASGKQAVLQATDSTLGEVVSQLTAALSAAVQGNSGTQNAANTLAVVQQLSGIRDSVLALANTSYLGVYLFAGSQQGSYKPFSVDTSTSPATTSYVGDNSIQSITTPNGQQLQVNLPGSSVFGTIGGDAGTGAFGALNQLISHFSTGTVSPSAANDISALTDALTQVSSQRSVLNSSLSRMQSTSTYVQTDEANLKVQQNSLVASDMTSVATQLQAAETQREALLNVIASLGSTNLFSYLK